MKPSSHSPQQLASDFFHQRYHQYPSLLVRAPGRVNLIGEHTDYNDGYVLPIAIDREIYFAARPRPDSQVNLHSLDLHQDYTFNLTEIQPGAKEPIEYIKGVAWALQRAGYPLTGIEGVFVGDIPIGAGLSSSAALEIAAARLFSAASGFAWQPTEMATLAQQAEREWVGVNCGIMDQLISAVGVPDHAVLIDCRTLETAPAPLPTGSAVIVLDTGTRRGLVDSAYNQRRVQCEAAAHAFGVPALRDLSLSEFEQGKEILDEVTRRRARHVISENWRVLVAAEALKNDDPLTFGYLMQESHASLKNDFEVSSPALDAIVELANSHPACFGARMTGAGFGGCAVALIDRNQTDSFIAHVQAAYSQQTGYQPQVYLCQASGGASVEFPG